MEYNTIFKKVANYKELHVYQKSDVLVLLTDVFCKRFLPAHGDRTVDQMNMAARSGKTYHFGTRAIHATTGWLAIVETTTYIATTRFLERLCPPKSFAIWQ